MSDQTAQLTVRPKASQQLAALIGMDAGAMLDAIKVQCFKGNAANVSNEQLAAFVSIAAEMGVNPFLPDMLYAYPGSGGSIIPIMGPSGIYKKLAEHPDVDSWETIVYPEDVSLPPTHAITKIWRKGRERPLSYTALVSEWKMNSNPNWASRCRHMIGLRSLKHCARQIIHGLPYDEDDRRIMDEINVTPDATPEAAPSRPPPPPRAKKGVAAVVENPPAEKPPVVDVEVVKPKPDPKAEPEPAHVPGSKPSATADIEADMAAREAKIAKQKAENLFNETPPVEEKQPEAPKIAQVARAFLKDGEEIQCVATVVEVTTLIVNIKAMPHPSVQATLRGGFSGSVLHVDGATSEGERLVPNKVWKVGAAVDVALVGRLNRASGKVLARVINVKEAQPESPAMDMD